MEHSPLRHLHVTRRAFGVCLGLTKFWLLTLTEAAIAGFVTFGKTGCSIRGMRYAVSINLGTKPLSETLQ